MAMFELTPPRLGGGSPMVDLYQTIVQAREKERIRQANMAKATVGSLISSYNSAKSQALQEEIIKSMKSYYGALSPENRLKVDPYITHGPTSPIAEKRRQFRQGHTPPKPVEFYEGVNEHEWAESQFRVSDYKRAEEAFLYGKPSTDRTKMFSLPDGNRIAVRDNEGMISITDGKNLAIDQMAKEFGLDPDKARRAVHLDNGRYPSGNKVTLSIGGVVSTYELDYNLLAKPGESSYSQRLVNQESVTLPPDTDFPKDLEKFMGGLALQNKKMDGVEAILGLIDDGKIAEAEDFFNTRWSDYTTNIVKIKEGDWWIRALGYLPPVALGIALGFFTNYRETGKADYDIRTVKGKLYPLKVDEGAPIGVYVDGQGIVRNERNEILGYNLSEATDYLLERTTE